MKIILGSQSGGRQTVLRNAGIKFELMPADIDEKAIRSDNYDELPLLIARGKADALTQRIHEPALLITADSVAVFKGELREKPETPQMARKYLASYTPDEPVWTSTGVIVTNTVTHKRYEGFASVATYFNTIPAEVIDELIETGRVFKWAGGFAIDDPLLKPYVLKVDGEPQSVYGLPLAITKQLLAQAAS